MIFGSGPELRKILHINFCVPLMRRLAVHSYIALSTKTQRKSFSESFAALRKLLQ